MPLPKISVIMPAYNSERYISKSIESVIAQTFTNWELIVVDDGSTDSTAEIIKGYEKKNGQIKYYYQTNKKQAVARNLGISFSKGEWIAFLDSDDLWKSNKLEIQHKFIEVVDADVFFTGGYIINESDKVLYDYKTIYGRFSGDEMYKVLYQWNPIPILSILVKKTWIKKTGPQDELKYIAQSCEDWDYWMRLAKMNAVFFGINEKVFFYRVHPFNTSSDLFKMRLGQSLIFIKNFDKDRFSNLEIRKIFKPFVIPLLANMVNDNKKVEVSILMENLFKKIPLLSFKICFFLLKTLKKYSFTPIRVVNKIDTILMGRGNSNH